MFVFHTLAYLFSYFKKVQESRLMTNKLSKVGGARLADTDFLPVHTRLAILKILIQEKWRGEISTIVVFGNGNLDFLQELYTIIGVTNIIFVHTDEALLENYKNNVNVEKCKHRHEKITTSLFVGSIGHPDSRIQDSEVVIAIDLIQNLYPDMLEALPYNVFGFIKPKLVIITTVNADFNVVFDGLDGFRSDQHQFEWNREQFESWAENICVRFPEYSVYFKGIGKGLTGTEQYGCCTQMAVFERCDFTNENIMSEVPMECRICKENIRNYEAMRGYESFSWGICTYCSYSNQIDRWEQRSIIQPTDLLSLASHSGSNISQFELWNYKMILWTEFNRNVADWSVEKQLIHEVEKCFLNLSPNNLISDDIYENHLKIPLFMLVNNSYGPYTTIPEIRKLLHLSNYVIEKRVVGETGKQHWCMIRPREMRESSNNSSESAEDTDEENWNTESTETVSSSSNPAPIQNVNAEPHTIEPNNTVNHVINDILVNLVESHQEGLLPFDDNKEEPNLEPLEGNYDNVFVFGKFKMENFKNPQVSSSEACTSAKSKAEKTKENEMKLAREKFSRMRNFDENEADIFKPYTSTETNNRLRTIEQKFNKTNIKDALFKMATNLESNNVAANNRNLKKDPTAGTSKVKKKTKPKKPETEEDIVKEDIKSLTNCIIYNSLNKIEPNEAGTSNITIIPLNQTEIITNNIEEAATSNNNNDSQANGNVDAIEVIPQETKNPEEIPIHYDISEMNSINVSSCEALFDPNSEIDMLDEVDVPQSEEPAIQANQEELQSHFVNQNVVVIGVRINEPTDSVEALPQNADPFPNWLLQLLGANVLEEAETHDEPHFYCQGDGLGVHPSIMEVDVEEDMSSSDSSSTSNDDAAENTISDNEINDHFEDIPYEEIENTDEYENMFGPLPSVVINTGRNHSQTSDSSEEFFDTIDHPLPRINADPPQQENSQELPENETPTTSVVKSETNVKLLSVKTLSSNTSIDKKP